MDLPNLLNKLTASSQEAKQFIAIEIGVGAIKTALWQSNGSHTEVLSTGSIQAWQGEDEEDLITAIDTSLADAQASVEKEPDQVIFGLSKTWVNDEGILPEKKQILKTICKKLGLKAIGYVVSIEAVTHHLRDIEGGPPSAVVVQIAETQIDVNLIYLGQIKGIQAIERSTSIAADVEEGLLKIPHDGNLPSRIILLPDSNDTETIKQELIAHDWQKRVSFLHLPKVESLAKDWSIRAIAIAGGSEVIASLGFANIDTTSKSGKKDISDMKAESKPDSSANASSSENSELESEAVSPQSRKTSDSTAELGFKPVTFDAASTIPDIDSAQKPSKEDDNVEPVDQDDFSHTPLPEPELSPPPPSKPIVTAVAAKKSKTSFFSVIASTLKKTIASSPKPLRFAVMGVGICLLILTAAAIYYQQNASAKLDIYVTAASYNQEINFILDPLTERTDINTNTIAAQKRSLTKTDTETITTTGSRLIGDRAKGKIALYNRTQAPKSFPAGSVIKADSLRFTLDTAVTIASASTKENPDFSTTTEPSKVEVAVTASDIGEQYNLAKETQFSVENFSKDSFFALALETFRGGSAKRVAAVDEADIETVKSALIEKLQQEMNQSSQEEVGMGQEKLVISEPIMSQEEFSALKGEEAEQLSLTATIAQNVYEFSRSDISLIAQSAASESLSQSQQIVPERTTFSLIGEPVEIGDDKLQLKAAVVLKHFERTDTQAIAKHLTNAPFTKLEERLRGLLTIYESHNLVEQELLFFNRLPPNPQNINLRIKVQNN
jgi:hypothetical protein